MTSSNSPCGGAVTVDGGHGRRCLDRLRKLVLSDQSNHRNLLRLHCSMDRETELSHDVSGHVAPRVVGARPVGQDSRWM